MSEINWRLGHLDHLASPWGNAGGVVKTVEDVEKMAKTGVGWIEAGSYTLEPRYGNDRNPETGEFIISEATGQPLKIYHHDPATGGTYNSLGMPNKGMDVVETELPEMVKIAEAHNKKLVVNVAPVTDDPLAETRELVTRAFEAGAHGVILNGGCPNVKTADGGRHERLSFNPRATYMVLSGLRDIVEKHHKIFYRVSPQGSYDRGKLLYRQVERTGTVSVISVPNTWSGMWLDANGEPTLEVPDGISSKSGPAIAEAAAKEVGNAVRILNGSGIEVVGASGIKNAPAIERRAAVEAKRQLDLGAVAVSGSTFYFEPTAGWAEDTDRFLTELVELF